MPCSGARTVFLLLVAKAMKADLYSRSCFCRRLMMRGCSGLSISTTRSRKPSAAEDDGGTAGSLVLCTGSSQALLWSVGSVAISVVNADAVIAAWNELSDCSATSPSIGSVLSSGAGSFQPEQCLTLALPASHCHCPCTDNPHPPHVSILPAFTWTFKYKYGGANIGTGNGLQQALTLKDRSAGLGT